MARRMLIVDDEKNIRKTIEMIHRNSGWDTASSENGAGALERLETERFDVVYLDLSMPGSGGMAVLKDIRERWPEQLVVILTGQGTIERAVEAIRLGAFDFLEKDCSKEKILLTSRKAAEYRSLAEENRMLRRKVSGRREFHGRSRPVREIFEQIDKVAPTTARVLILGESGTGKELIAQAIHDRSGRSGAAFIKVNCAAIPEELIEAEFFGSVKGAFTGAESRIGKFEAADGGTLFLDEVGDMSLRVQTKVLRALQEGEIEKVGSNKTIKVDVRVVAATNKDLEGEVRAGRFREDLYFRLNVVPIIAPPLRERPDDIACLAEAFVKEYSEESGLVLKRLDDDVLRCLQRYAWPGNVRELRNQVERMVIMSHGHVVRASDLSAELRGSVPVALGDAAVPGAPVASGPGEGVMEFAPGKVSLQEAKRRYEREVIRQALERNHWNVSRTAEELGLERTNLHKKIRQFELTRETK